MLLITHSQNIDEILESSNFWERVKLMDSQVFLLGQNHQKSNIPCLSTWQEALEVCESDTISWLDSQQVFFDADVIQHGLSTFNTIQWDYFTQWEFANLPVGVGIRAFNTKHPSIANWDQGPQELLDYILDHPYEFKSFYDEEVYIPFNQSLYSALYSHANKSLLLESDFTHYNLSEFIELTQKHPQVNWQYQSNEAYPYCDERGLKAAYGFESPECADFPTYVMFEMVNRCNAQCIHCPQGLESFRESIDKTSKITETAFKNFIDQCVGRKIDFVRITADGEPLLHSQLFDLIKYASDNGVGPVGLTTNGSLLNEKKARELINSGLFMVDISLDARRRETYEVVRKGLDYDQVHQNILRLVELRDELKSPLQIMVSMVKQEQNHHEVSEFEEYWSDKIDKVLIREMHTNVNQNGEYSAMEEEYRWPCAHWFRRITINYDGDVKGCPIDWDNKSVFEVDGFPNIYKVWHSDFYRSHRKENLNKKFSSTSICKNCGDWKGTPWHLGYEKVIKEMNGDNNG